ncbi:MAG: HAMP domain-containing histidine kinase, partial [Erysipelotrichaceae bacterium]|nr:HAMP domain-containing histidine kinase [Erysipelotrichaceae bacterium]
MKFNFKGIRFSTWLYFLGFSVSMMVLLGFLLVVFIKPYYKNDRINTIDSISGTMESLLLKDNVSKADVESASRTILGNNVCALILNEAGNSVYSPPDSLGQLCLLDKEITIADMTFTIKDDPAYIINSIKRENPYSLTLDSPYADVEMLIYGKQIKSTLSNYYLIMNTPLEPIESYIDFILNQYLYVALIVVMISLVVSFILARNITEPIVQMKNEANKLAQGNYDARFEIDSFSEINDLASTLDDATVKLSKVNELRKDLVANVSHDIKTPLTMIKAYAEMIKDIS